MLVKICTKNEQLQPCDILIAKEGALLQVSAQDLKGLLEAPPEVLIVKEKENMLLKSGILLAQAIAGLDGDDAKGAVSVSCTDKPILEAVCSLDYARADSSVMKCAPAGAKPTAPPRVRNRAKPTDKPDGKPSAPASAEPPAEQAEPENAPGAPADDKNDSLAGMMDDPVLTTGEEVNLESATQDGTPAPKPGEAPAARIMKMLKDAGVPSGQLPGVLDAIRESIDPDITLPMQVRLRVMKDGAGDEMAVEETTRRVAPLFTEIKSLMKEAQEA